MFFKGRIATLKAAIDSAGPLKDHIYEYLRDVRTGMTCLSRTHYGATSSYTAVISSLMGSNDRQWGNAVNEVLSQFDAEIFEQMCRSVHSSRSEILGKTEFELLTPR